MDSKYEQLENGVGAIAVMLLVLIPIIAIIASIVIGLFFGAAYGWSVIGAFLLVFALYLFGCLINSSIKMKKMKKELENE